MNQFRSKAKGDESLMEDSYVMTTQYIAVFDGATPKTAFRFTDGRTPGQVASQTLAACLSSLPATLLAEEVITKLSISLRQALQGHRGEASGVIFNRLRKEIWLVGDCQFAFIYADGRIERHHTEKRIDHILSSWRSSILHSFLSRGVMTPEEIAAEDPGRKIIQPFISRQIRYQNIPSDHSDEHLGFGVFDGNEIPAEYIEIYPIPANATELILASDGYPTLYPTLEETETALQLMLKDDPLCINSLCGTKGIRLGNESHDDRTYIKVSLIQ